MTQSVDTNPFDAPREPDVVDLPEDRSFRPYAWCGVALMTGIGVAMITWGRVLRNFLPGMDIGVVGVAMTVLAAVLLCLIACRRLSRQQAIKVAACICLAMWLAFVGALWIQVQRQFAEGAYVWLGGGAWLSLSLSLPLAWLISGQRPARKDNLKTGVNDDAAVHG